MTASFRRHGRTVENSAIRLEIDEIGEVVAELRDISETGIFVKCKKLVEKLNIGDAIRTNFDESRSGNELTVVRVTDEGVGFAFK